MGTDLESTSLHFRPLSCPDWLQGLSLYRGPEPSGSGAVGARFEGTPELRPSDVAREEVEGTAVTKAEEEGGEGGGGKTEGIFPASRTG